MKIITIDLAARNTGIAITDENLNVLKTFRFIPVSPDFFQPDFLSEHHENIKQLLEEKPDLVAIESPAMSAGNLQFSIGMVYGLYTLFFFKTKTPVLILPPRKWFKVAAHSGKATKLDLKNAAKSYFPKYFETVKRISQDECDALGMAYVTHLALRLLSGEKLDFLPKDELQCFTKKGEGFLADQKLSFNLLENKQFLDKVKHTCFRS